METPLYFKNQAYKLFGVLHQPEENTSTMQFGSSTLGIVFCHPFAEEKLISHRAIVGLARAFTKIGIYCLRFDYMGHGDSEGNFEDSTIESRISDIKCAVNYMKNQTDVQKAGLIGIRLGATLAALACNNSFIEFLVLIAPIINGKTYIEQCLRSNLTTQMATHKKILKDRKELIEDLLCNKHVNIDGYLLSRLMYQQFLDINLLNTHFTLPPHILLLALSKHKNQDIDRDLQSLYSNINSTSNSLVVLNKIREHPCWTDTKIYMPHSTAVQQLIFDFVKKRFLKL